MHQVTLLMTCVGGQLSPWLLKSLKSSDRIAIRTVGTDGQADALGRSFADAFFVVPMGDHPDYAERLLDICRQEHVDMVFPTSDEEAYALAGHAAEFAAEGIAVCAPPAHMVPIMRSKGAMYDYLATLGLPLPEYHRVKNREALQRAASALGYPERDILVKPSSARGGRGVWIISKRTPTLDELNKGLAIDSLTLETYLAAIQADSFPEHLAMPLLSGAMYDVDVLSDGETTYYLIPRRRYHVRTTPFRGCWLDPHPGVLDLATRLQDALRLPHLFDYDIILDAEGRPWVLEVNPRMSASVAVSVLSGVNLLEYLVLLLLGREVPETEIPWGRGGKPIFDLVPFLENVRQ
jgi:carbamoyl-phosphate synthase large subunit